MPASHYRDVRPDEEADTTRPPLNARWLCNYFLVRFADGQVAILTKIAYQPQEQRWVRFEDFAGGVRVAVSQEFLEEMGREVLRASRGSRPDRSGTDLRCGAEQSAPNKRLHRTGISLPVIDKLPLVQLSPGR